SSQNKNIQAGVELRWPGNPNPGNQGRNSPVNRQFNRRFLTDGNLTRFTATLNRRQIRPSGADTTQNRLIEKLTWRWWHQVSSIRLPGHGRASRRRSDLSCVGPVPPEMGPVPVNLNRDIRPNGDSKIMLPDGTLNDQLIDLSSC